MITYVENHKTYKGMNNNTWNMKENEKCLLKKISF